MTAAVETIQHTTVSSRQAVPVSMLRKCLFMKRMTRSIAEEISVASISVFSSFLFSQIPVKDHFPSISTGRKQNRIKSAVHASDSRVPRVNAL